MKLFAKISIVLIMTTACIGVDTGCLNTTELLRSSIMSEPIQTKYCSHCKQIKSVSEFSKDRNAKDGLHWRCKGCRKQYGENHRIENRQYSKQYYQTLRGHLNQVWNAMLRRCNNPKDQEYKNYGSRGIEVKFACFEDFYNYVVKELKVEPRSLTIDRINNDGHYEKGNIRFVTYAENNRNKRRKR